MGRKLKIIMIIILLILIALPFVLFAIFYNKIDWKENFVTILIGILTYVSTIILAFVANLIAVSSQLQLEKSRKNEQKIKWIEKKNLKIENNMIQMSNAIKNYDNRIFEYFAYNILDNSYKDMIAVVNDALRKIDSFQLELEQIEDYYCIDMHCLNCKKKCNYEKEFKDFLIYFKNKTKEFIDLIFVSIGVMSEVLKKNELAKSANDKEYFFEEIRKDIDKINEYKNKAFNLYVEIKGLIVKYRNLCQKQINLNNNEIDKILTGK